jgi:cytoskeletal protein CcmA (bactofilin family)
MGDILHQSLSVEMGAVFEGQCKYLQDPLSQANTLGNAPPRVVAPEAPRSDFGGFGESEPAVSTSN